MIDADDKTNEHSFLGIFWGKGKIIIVIPLLAILAFLTFFLRPSVPESPPSPASPEPQSSPSPPELPREDQQMAETFVCDKRGKPALNIMLVTGGQVAFPDQLGNIRFRKRLLGNTVSIRYANSKREILTIQIPVGGSLPERIVIAK